MKIHFLMALCWLCIGQLNAQEKHIDGELIIKTQEEIAIRTFLNQLDYSAALPDFTISQPVFGYHLLTFQTDLISTTALKQFLSAQTEVESVSYNYLLEPRNTPNDVLYPSQWGMDLIEIEKVWEYTTGGQTIDGHDIVVAVMDSGFDWTHEDLIDNIWVNPAESNGQNGLDDDNNQLADDFNGWNFVQNSPNHKIDGHGTSVLGILGATGNNSTGVSGVNWKIKLMPLTVSTPFQIAQGYEYAMHQRALFNATNGQQGAFVVATSASLGFDNVPCNDLPIWGDLFDPVGQTGIINVAATTNRDNTNVDVMGDMPTSCPSDYLISVTNTDVNDLKVAGAGIGATSIDLAAPGGALNTGSITTGISDGYDMSFGGTSAATPHVAGTIALLYSLDCQALVDAAMSDPGGTALLMKKVILESTDILVGLQDKTVTGGRLNAASAMNHIHGFCQDGDLTRALEEETDLGAYTTFKNILNLYPNPADDVVNLEYAIQEFGELTIQVHHISGKFVFEETVSVDLFDRQLWSLDVSGLANGSYFVTILNGKNPISQKFVKL